MTDPIDTGLRGRAAEALERGRSALAARQSGDGSFPFGVLDPSGPGADCHPLFSTVTVLLAAGSLLPPDRLARAVDFVLAARRPDGMWEYDARLGIPADADDTACALAVAARHRPGCVGEADAALLRTYWRTDGGPFRTWHTTEAMWTGRERDDAVVNANVALALAALGSPATAGEMTAIARLVSASMERTRYYCAPATVAYTALRAGVPAHAVPAPTLARPEPAAGCLPTAQWLCATGSADPDALAWLLARQRADGSWPAEAWCTDNVSNWGSDAITTAICAEALALLPAA